jgi:hypothetical protein
MNQVGKGEKSIFLCDYSLMLINQFWSSGRLSEGLWELLRAEDLRALTPLFHPHINPYGQFGLDQNRPSFLEAA